MKDNLFRYRYKVKVETLLSTAVGEGRHVCCCVVEDKEGEEREGEVQETHGEGKKHGLSATEETNAQGLPSQTPSGLRRPDFVRMILIISTFFAMKA